MNHNDITAGQLGNNGNNSEVLKELYNKQHEEQDLNDLINELDTSIKYR